MAISFKQFIAEESISMSNYMDKGQDIPPEFSVHNVKKTIPKKIKISNLRFGQSAVRKNRDSKRKQQNTGPIAIVKNNDGTFTIGDGHHRTVEAIHRGKTHIMAYVHIRA